MDGGDDRVQTIDAGRSGADPGRRRRPPLLLVGALAAAAVVAFLTVSEPPPDAPDPTVPDGPPTLPELSTTTTIPAAPDLGPAFEADTTLTWAPVSGLAQLEAIDTVVEVQGEWWLVGGSNGSQQLYRSTNGIRWEETPLPIGPEDAVPRITDLVATDEAVALVGTVPVPGEGEVPGVWWTTDGPWSFEELPTRPVASAPSEARATIDVVGAARVGDSVVISAERVLTTVPSLEGVPATSPRRELPAGWAELLERGLATVGETSPSSLGLVVDPFLVAETTYEELGLLRYRTTWLHRWVASPFQSPVSVDTTDSFVDPVGTRPDGTAYGFERSFGRLVVSDDGVTWNGAGSIRGFQLIAPWQRGWVGAFGTAVQVNPDGSGWEPMSPEGFLGPPSWRFVDLSTSELGILGLAVVTPDPAPASQNAVRVEGSNGAMVVFRESGELTVLLADGGAVDIGGMFSLASNAVSLDYPELVFVDPDSGDELTRVAVPGWVQAVESLGDRAGRDLAVVHSPDGEHWSARRADFLAGPLAEGGRSLHVQDDFALLVVEGDDVPRVWAGFPRPGRG